MSERAVSAGRLWWLVAGYGLWCTALVAIYALHAIGCAFAWPAGALRLGLALLLLAHLIVLGWMWLGYARPDPEPALGETGSFLRWVVLWTLITAFVTVVLTLGPTLLVTTCV